MTNDSFGARLRRERERRQITLAQIAETTKIQASLFEALERDNVSRWPGGIFRRAFIRAYAQAIGLDPERTCREFVERFPEPGDVPSTPPSPSEPVGGAQRATPADVARFPITRTGTTVVWADFDNDAPPRLRLADQALLPLTLRSAGADQAAPETSRWRTVALDFGAVLIVALTAFIVLDRFWMPLAVTSVLYYVGSSLLSSATPAALFFAATTKTSDDTRVASPAVTSLDRALDMRDVLMADARPRSVTPSRRQPVDIDARRVRA